MRKRERCLDFVVVVLVIEEKMREKCVS